MSPIELALREAIAARLKRISEGVHGTYTEDRLQEDRTMANRMRVILEELLEDGGVFVPDEEDEEWGQ